MCRVMNKSNQMRVKHSYNNDCCIDHYTNIFCIFKKFAFAVYKLSLVRHTPVFRLRPRTLFQYLRTWEREWYYINVNALNFWNFYEECIPGIARENFPKWFSRSQSLSVLCDNLHRSIQVYILRRCREDGSCVVRMWKTFGIPSRSRTKLISIVR